jgi:hypothetical protein
MQKTLTLLLTLLSAGVAHAGSTIGSGVTFACGGSEASLISRGVVRVSAGSAAIVEIGGQSLVWKGQSKLWPPSPTDLWLQNNF